MARVEKLNGPEKAAVLLISLGDELAALVLKHLDDKEIQTVGNYMSVVGKVPSDKVDRVNEEFFKEAAQGEGGFALGGLDYVKKILSNTLEPWKVQEIIDKIAPPGEEDFGGGLDIIRQLDAKTIGAFLKNEHPQTCAIVLSHLDGDHAAEVLSELPEKFQTEVFFRMATLDRVGPGVIKELEDALAAEFKAAGATEGAQIGGIPAVAEILNQIDHSTEARILADIEETNPSLAEDIRKLMFVFEDLIKVDARGMQSILKEVANEDLLIALKTASEPLKEMIFTNMSERASQMMKEDLDAMGPVRLSDVEKAQSAIIRSAKKLEEEGKIVIGGGGEELV